MPISSPDCSVRLPGEDLPACYARSLLEDLGARVSTAGDHPAKRWADNSLMAMTGSKDGPRICPVPLPGRAHAVLAAIGALTAVEVLPGVAGSQLLVERPAIAGY
jgi:hypothetical protein